MLADGNFGLFGLQWFGLQYAARTKAYFHVFGVSEPIENDRKIVLREFPVNQTLRFERYEFHAVPFRSRRANRPINRYADFFMSCALARRFVHSRSVTVKMLIIIISM